MIHPRQLDEMIDHVLLKLEPDPPPLSHMLFERLELPRNLTWSSLIDGFHAAPTSNVFLVSVAGGHVRTIAPRSSRLDCTKVRARPSSHWRCGFDAWQRYKRFEYYLYWYVPGLEPRTSRLQTGAAATLLPR